MTASNKSLLQQARDALQDVLKAHRLDDKEASARLTIICAVSDAEQAIAALTAAIDAPESEPVAWIVEFENGERELHWNDTKESLGETQTPLYLHPPAPHQPLSDAEIDAVTVAQWGKHNGAYMAAYRAYVRAIESKIGAKP